MDSGSGPWVLNPDSWVLGSGFWILDQGSGFGIVDFEFQVLDPES